MAEKIETLIAQMTLQEKISLLAGADQWLTVPIQRLGVPAIKMTDGPIGARGIDDPSGPTSACFPCGTALGATWNPELVERVGQALAEETQAKGAHILLAPTVNIHRSPIAGRNFECYSEDPHLTAQMAIAYINGLQNNGVSACIKHLVCNDSEFERHTMSSEVDERPLREIYLRPFQTAIRQAKPWAVMSSYNRLNGTSSSENSRLLLDILKGEWGFEGIVISDWYGTYTSNVAKGGLDLEMPGPARWMGQPALAAVQAGEVSQEMIDDKVRRLLHTIEKVGAFEKPALRPEQAIDKPEHRRVAREAATEAIVLLKNSNSILPLGANARWASIMGGCSVRVTLHYVVTPLEAIKNKAGDKVSYAIGCSIHKLPLSFDRNWLNGDMTLQYFANRQLAGEPVHSEMTRKMDLVWFGDEMPHVEPANFSVRLSGAFTPPESGRYDLSLLSIGKSRLSIDGKELFSLWDKPAEDAKTTTVELVAGRSYKLQVEYASEPGPRWRNLRVGCMPQIPADSIQQAADLAAKSDAAIVFAGLTNEWESEGFDRPDMELPGDQVKLIEQVSAANRNTIVVINAGSPISMNWLDQVAGVVQAWYLGQETGNAIADILFGDANPSGKLPTTFPKRLQDNPAYLNYPGENGKVRYGEGLYVGYRYYEKKDITPQFPFGFGLSYTTFDYSKLTVSAREYAAGEEIRVSVDVQNTGKRAGKEIVQVYVRQLKTRLTRPYKELKAFAKVALAPGETQTVKFALDQQALSYYDPARLHWVADAGEFELLVGSSSRDIRQTARFSFKGEPVSAGSHPARLHVRLTLKTLLDDPAGKAVLEKHMGGHMSDPEVQMISGMSLEQLATMAPQLLTPELLKKIDDDLAKE